MKRRLGTVAVLAAFVAALLGAGAPSASAATEYGSHCEPFGSKDGEWASLERLAPFPGGALETSGVITRWRLNLEHLLFLDDPSERLKTYTDGGGPGPEVSGESTSVPTTTAANGVATRIPVRKGDLVGLQSKGEEGLSIYCEEEGPGSVVAFAEGNPQVGEEVNLVTSIPEAALPVRVRIEPDADHDGYGDESQDGCPTDSSTHGPCPLVSPPPLPPPLTPHPSGKTVAHKGSVTVKASTDVAGPVTVSGKVKLGKGKSATLNGGTQTLAAGQQGSFTLTFTKKLKVKLATLPAKRELKLAITVSAANSAGVSGTQSLSLKLHGQDR